MDDLDTLFDETENDLVTYENKLHWYNAQKKCLRKREFWRAVIYALTRPDDYKPILLEKAKAEKEKYDKRLESIRDYGMDVGFVPDDRVKTNY